MASSDVRSIDSLRGLRSAVLELAHDWDLSLQQIRFAMHRIEEHFGHVMPSYWKQETRLAEQRLTEAMDNLSRQQGNTTDGNAPALTEAKQRVQLARRRLAFCEEKSRTAKKISLQVEQMCKDLSGPLAEATGHVSVNLPAGAEKLAQWIGHLDRYAEKPRFTNTPASSPQAHVELPDSDTTGSESPPEKADAVNIAPAPASIHDPGVLP